MQCEFHPGTTILLRRHPQAGGASLRTPTRSTSLPSLVVPPERRVREIHLETSHPHGPRSLAAGVRGGPHPCESASERYHGCPRRRGTCGREIWPCWSRYFLMNSRSTYVQ